MRVFETFNYILIRPVVKLQLTRFPTKLRLQTRYDTPRLFGGVAM